MALGGRPERDERRVLFSISQASPIKDFSSDLPKGCSFEPDRRPAFSYYCPQFHRPGVDRTAWTRVAILLARISFACRDRQKDFVFPRPRCQRCDSLFRRWALRQATGVLAIARLLKPSESCGISTGSSGASFEAVFALGQTAHLSGLPGEGASGTGNPCPRQDTVLRGPISFARLRKVLRDP